MIEKTWIVALALAGGAFAQEGEADFGLGHSGGGGAFSVAPDGLDAVEEAAETAVEVAVPVRKAAPPLMLRIPSTTVDGLDPVSVYTWIVADRSYQLYHDANAWFVSGEGSRWRVYPQNRKGE